MDEHILSWLCRHYSLGAPTAAPRRVRGGLVHRMYRVQTAGGKFAVKALNPHDLKNPGARDRHRSGERIAAAVADAGLPAVAALTCAGDALCEVGERVFLVYPWINGQMLSSASAGPGRAALIGRILGRIHALPIRFPNLDAPAPLPFSLSDWTPLIQEARTQRAEWADELHDALPDLARWERALAEARQALPPRWVISHADLHQQNVLWSDEQTPHLIDWESAGPQQPAKEAVVSALEWSGFVEGYPDLVTFRAFLNAYGGESPLLPDAVRHGLGACLGNWLGWLHFNMRRALALTGGDGEEQALGAQQTTGTLATIRRVEAHFPALIAAGGG